MSAKDDFLKAIREADIDKAFEIMDKHKISPNIKTAIGGDPLIYLAVRDGMLGGESLDGDKFLRGLIERGAKTNIKYQGDSLLHVPALKSSTAKVLIENGVDINSKRAKDGTITRDVKGDTPLHAAIRNNDLALASTLVEAGAKTDVKNSKGESAVSLANSLYSKEFSEVMASFQPKLDVARTETDTVDSHAPISDSAVVPQPSGAASSGVSTEPGLPQQVLSEESTANETSVIEKESLDNVTVQNSTVKPEAEESFIVEHHRKFMANFGDTDIDVALLMSTQAFATSHAEYQAAQIVSGNDRTEAGKELVADLMQYEGYRGAFKESIAKIYDDIPDAFKADFKSEIEVGLAVVGELIKNAEASYGVAKVLNQQLSQEEVEALSEKYGSRISLVDEPDLTLKGSPMMVSAYDEKFGLIGAFEGSHQSVFVSAMLQVEKKERQLAAEHKASDTQEPEPIAPAATPLGAQPTAVPDTETPTGPEVAVIPARPVGATGTDPSATAESGVDTIWVGPPRPRGEDAQPQVSQIDKDALLARLTDHLQDDKRVLYKLDGEPAFFDRGMRLEMAEGASQNDEMVLAALLTAATFYRGRIELTGSDEFQRKAIGLIAQHQLNVTMKNPGQQAQLVAARKALQEAPVVKDSINGESPPAHGVPPQPSAAPVGTPVTVSPVADATAVNMPAAANPVVDIGEKPQPDARPVGEKTVTGVPSNTPLTSSEAQLPRVNGASQKVSPEIHQSHEAAKNGVTGKVISFGQAPFRFEEGNTESTYIKLRTKAGTQTYWGKELAGLLRETRLHPGKVVSLQWKGKEAVVVKVPIKDEHGVTMRFEDKDVHRNKWSLAVLGGSAARTGEDEGVRLAAYDVQRFGLVQQELVARLGLDIPLPSTPTDGLYWMTPDGQGSAKTGDALSAPRPVVDSKAAGQPVMSSWSKDGHLDMVLVRGDGPYLQGVAREGGGQFQHVLVSLPGSEDAPPMVFNAVTPGGLVPIGSGNGINRSSGEPVSRENIAFKLDGDSDVRIGKLDRPADLPPALHARLGFDERWREDNTLPKSAPAAAPSVQPSEPRPA